LQQVADARRLSVLYPESEQAFTDLLLPVVDSGYRLACAMLHDIQGAQDAVQEASLTAWRKFGRLDDRTRMRSWFLGIVANECRNARRKRWIAGVTLGLPSKLSVRSNEERMVAGADVRRALARLRHRDRLVVALFFYLDLPLEEVAATVGDSVVATRARLYRSIKRLRPDLRTEEALQ
jgi:RNA polymerase sigma-70 factor (ECF subfamily)